MGNRYINEIRQCYNALHSQPTPQPEQSAQHVKERTPNPYCRILNLEMWDGNIKKWGETHTDPGAGA